MLRPFLKRLRTTDFTLDKAIAALILLFAIVFIVLSIGSGRYGVTEPLILLALPLFYLIFRRKISQGGDLPKFQYSNRIRAISHIVFLFSISLSIWLLWSNPYYRPPLYFVLLAVAASSIMLNIFCSEEKESHAIIPLVKIIALSLSVYAGIYYQFSGIYGVDPWLHNRWIEETVNLGHVTEGEVANNTYYLFPVFHLTAAVTQILTSLSSYSSVFLSTGILIAVSGIFVFLIGRRLFGTKTGVLAALIVPLTNYSIERATAIVPMSLGFCFFLATLYLVFCQDEKKSLKYSVLIIVLSVSLILTHAIPTLVTLLSLIAIFAGVKWYKQMAKPATAYELVSPSVIVFLAITMLLWWMQIPPWGRTFFDYRFSLVVESLQHGIQFLPIELAPSPSNPFAVRLYYFLVSTLDEGGFLLLLAFAIIGSLIYLHPQNRTGPRMALILTAAVLIGIPRGSGLLHLGFVLPHRWFIFQCVLLSILAIQGLLGISNLIRGSVGKLSLVMITVLIMLFMMTATNRGVNGDSPLFYNGATRIGYTESEIGAIRTLSDMGIGYPMTDLYCSTMIPYVVDYETYIEMLGSPNNVFIVRNYFLHHPDWDNRYVSRMRRVGVNVPRWGEYQRVVIMDYLREQGIDKGPLIYDNGKVKAYAMLR